ncbi:MAG: hypothetical protein ACNA8W_20000, partial [Bradymonadaceae bacterium]
EAPFDVALVAHGLGGERQSTGLALANELAAYPSCLATVTMDFLMHGGRVAGSTDLHPLTRDEASGTNFLSADIIRSKNNFLQSAIDLMVLTQIIKGANGMSGLEGLFALYDEAELEGPLFSTNVAFVGPSLGGIVGTLFLAVEPEVSTAVLSNTGGKLSSLLEESTVGEPIMAQLAALGVEAGTLGYLQTMAFVQWLADHADPFTFAPYVEQMQLDTLVYDETAGTFGPVLGAECDTAAECPDRWVCRNFGSDNNPDRKCLRAVPPNEVLLHMTVGDTTIPNSSTTLLADTIGVSLEHTTFEDTPHNVLGVRDADNAAYPQSLCARQQAAQWLTSGLAGEAQLPASLYADACVAAGN